MKKVTLKQLRLFEAVARHRNFSRAAEELHLSQPAVSLQIKQLEECIGLPLFEQMGRKIYLTEAGVELSDHQRIIARQLREAEERFAAMRGKTSGRLDIAIVSTAKYFIPRLLAKFCRRFPETQPKLVVSNREEILDLLARNDVDLAVMGRPPEGIDCVAQPFARNPHGIIAFPSHPLATVAGLRIGDLTGETFLLRESGSGVRIALERLLLQHGVAIRKAIEMGTNETIKQAVMAEMGISFLSLHTVQAELGMKRLAILDVEGLPLVSDWYVVHRESKRLLPIPLAFKTYLLDESTTDAKLQSGG